VLRDATEADFPAILALNTASVRFTSPLDDVRLRALHAQAAYHRVFESDGATVGFLLALREGADYASPNSRWFAQRYDELLYGDRIVVGDAWQGRGLGAVLYEDLFVFAQSSGVAQVTCEFDLKPSNPASARFHARFGFKEVGTQWLAGGKKQVSLQARPL